MWADLDARDNGLRQNALQNLHGFTVLCEHSLHNGLHPGGVTLHPQVGLDASQQLPPLHRLAVHTTDNHVRGLSSETSCHNAKQLTKTQKKGVHLSGQSCYYTAKETELSHRQREQHEPAGYRFSTSSVL